MPSKRKAAAPPVDDRFAAAALDDDFAVDESDVADATNVSAASAAAAPSDTHDDDAQHVSEHEHANDDENDDDGAEGEDAFLHRVRHKEAAPITLKKLMTAPADESEAAEAASGVVYLARVPERITPAVLRQLLSRHASIGRIYLAPEDKKTAHRRNKHRSKAFTYYTEGWIEFTRKRQAKHLAALLNATPIGGPRKMPYHADLWSLKYLPKFKWRHLAEQVAYERKVREQKLQAEIAQSRREVKAIRETASRAQMHERLDSKAAQKAEKAAQRAASTTASSSAEDGAAASADAGPATKKAKKASKGREWTFRQRAVVDTDSVTKTTSDPAVLNNIFG